MYESIIVHAQRFLAPKIRIWTNFLKLSEWDMRWFWLVKHHADLVIIRETWACISLKKLPKLTPILLARNFQTWLVIGWQHSCQPIKSHVRKSLLIYMDLNMDVSQWYQLLFYFSVFSLSSFRWSSWGFMAGKNNTSWKREIRRVMPFKHKTALSYMTGREWNRYLTNKVSLFMCSCQSQ